MDQENKELNLLAKKISEQGYSGICFWLPSRSTGGGTINLAKYAEYLAQNTELNIYFMDYKDGYSHDLLKQSKNITFIDYNDQDSSLPIQEPIIIVVNTTRVVQIKNMHPRSKILFWHWETIPCAWDVVLINREAKKFLQLAYKNKALVYHDWSSRNIFKLQFGLEFKNQDYLTVLCKPREVTAVSTPIRPGKISIGWLGRLSTDKICSLYNLMDNLAKLQDSRPKRLVVIGDGPHRKASEVYAERYKDKIEVIFVGTVDNEELADCMVNTMDIVFGVGTSVVEAAACKLPAAIAQMNTGPFDSDEFILLNDTEEYCLGITCEQRKDFRVSFTKFKDIILKVYTEQGKEVIGENCYKFYRENFCDTDAVCKNLLRFCEQSSLTIEKLCDCIHYIPYNKLHVKAWRCHGTSVASVTTYENVKTWRLLNMPLWKVEYCGAETRYYLFGFRLYRKYDRGVFNFPGTTARYVPGKKSVKDRHAEAFYKKELRRREMCKQVAEGKKLCVCLFVSRISCWNFEKLYQLLEDSPYFIPTVVVKPFAFQGKDAMMQYMDITYNTLKERGFRVLRTYEPETDTYMNVREQLDPDILVFTKSWRQHFHKDFYIDNFFDRITFLCDYCYPTGEHDAVYNFDMNNYVDRYFMPNSIVRGIAANAMNNEGANLHVTGSPKLDWIFDKSYKPKDVWKPQNTPKKRIIWAPHHSDAFPNNLYQFNAFFELYDFMFEVAEQYKDSIQIAFKPHPMLRYKLEAKWGKEKTDAYYEKWADIENGQLEEGEFIDLFLTSDAMIFDCVSFIAEYMASGKPAFFTIGQKTRVMLNEFGMMAFDHLYKTEGDLQADIRHFIEKTVLEGKDAKKNEREAFVQQYMLPPNGKSASENIYDQICEEVFGEEMKPV